MRHLLHSLCLFTIAAGLWLGVMENLFKHDGYAQRSMIAVGIVVQGLATLSFLLRHGQSRLRNLVLVGAGVFVFLGGSATVRILQAQHIAGFVLGIGIALALQGGHTLVELLPKPPMFAPDRAVSR